jgi:hypothetical protein
LKEAKEDKVGDNIFAPSHLVPLTEIANPVSLMSGFLFSVKFTCTYAHDKVSMPGILRAK